MPDWEDDPEARLVFEQLVDGVPAYLAHWKAQQKCLVESGNPFTDTEQFQDFAEISRQRSFPTKSVDDVSEKGRNPPKFYNKRKNLHVSDLHKASGQNDYERIGYFTLECLNKHFRET